MHAQPTWLSLEIRLNLRAVCVYAANLAISSKFDQLARSLRIRSQLGHTLETRLLIEALHILLHVPSHQV
jgi:hypothetical protein